MYLTDAVAAIRPSVVQIAVRLERSELPRTLGTGFIVDERGTVVTAWHVIEAGVDLADPTREIESRPQFVAGLAHPQRIEVGEVVYGMQGFSYVDLELLLAVPDHDLGVARLKDNVLAGDWDQKLVPVIDGVPVPPLAAAAILDTSRPPDGAAVAVSGYPFAMNSLITNNGCLASAFVPTFGDAPTLDAPPENEGTQGEVLLVEGPLPEHPVERYLADLEVNGGNSGGPVYLVETAHVIGVCVATRSAPVMRAGRPMFVSGEMLTYSSGLTVVVPSTYVAEALRDKRVAKETSEPGRSP